MSGFQSINDKAAHALWVALWEETRVSFTPGDDLGETMYEVGIELADWFCGQHGLLLEERDPEGGPYEIAEENGERFSAWCSVFEISFWLGRQGWADELVAARIGEAVNALDKAAERFPKEALIKAIQQGYTLGTEYKDLDADGIWNAWNQDHRSVQWRRDHRIV